MIERMTNYERCLARVQAYAAGLREAVRSGRLNENAVEGLVRSFVEQPAYYPEDRAALIAAALR